MDRFTILTGKEYEYKGPEIVEGLENRIQERINASIERYVGSRNIFEVRRQIKNEISRILIDFLDDRSLDDFPASEVRVEIRLESEGVVRVYAGNLYTLLLWHGIFIPFPQIEGKSEYIDLKRKVKYSFKDGCPMVEDV